MEEKSKYELVKFNDGELEMDVNVSPSEETIWLSLDEMSLLFERDRSVIGKHISNIYKEGELDIASTCAKNAHMGTLGVQRYEVLLYNLDVIISVGYRVKSKNLETFYKWAKDTLNKKPKKV